MQTQENRKKLRFFSIKETDYFFDVMYSPLERRIIKCLGSRDMAREELNELSSYWVASCVRRLWGEEDISLMEELELQNYFLNSGGNWERGISDYSKMAQTSLLDLIDKKISLNGDCKILDVGCGDGFFLRELKEKYGDVVELYGIAPLFNQNNFKNVNFMLSLAEILPEIWTNKFDLVTCFEASMYFWNQAKAFNEILRVTKPDGNAFYGGGNFKGGTNDNLLERKLNLENFSYTGKEGYRAGQTFEKTFGKYISMFLPFYNNIRKLVDEKTFSFEEKKFSIDCVETLAWCTSTYRINGHGLT